jgi:acyl dehydratase
VKVGSRIRLLGRVASVDDVPGDGVQVAVDLTVEVEGAEKPALIARALYRYYG